MHQSNEEQILRHAIDLHSMRIDEKPSEAARRLIMKWGSDGQTAMSDDPCIERVSWTDTYLSMAHIIAKRSHDAQTQCGCVIVSEDMKPLSWGYNGFLAGIWDDILPNKRPDKYPWMLHSELNAILNCNQSLKGGIVYVTGHPCLHCFQCMCQVGISRIIYDQNHSIVMIDDDLMAMMDVVKWLTKTKIEVIPYDYVPTE